MCQSKAKGGKRCAAHTPGNQAVVALVVSTTGLDDAQAASILRRARASNADAPAPTADQVRGFLDSVAAQAEWDERPSDKDVATVKRHVKAALADVDAGILPDGPTMASWEAGHQQGMAASAALEDVIVASAAARRMDPNRAAAAFRHWRRDPSRFDHCESPDPAFRLDADALGLPSDKATVTALGKLGWENHLAQRLPVFVYGTLREGQHNRGRFGNAVETSERGSVTGVAIYGADWGFPYAREHDDPASVTVGDLVEVSDDGNGDYARHSLDMLEGFNNDWPEQSHYRRVVREVQVVGADGQERTVKAWTYLAGDYAAGRLTERERIADGDWVGAKQAAREERYRPRLSAR